MSFLNSNKVQDRQEAAAKARKAMAEKFLSRPQYDLNDPAVIAREAERRKVLESRVEREKERALRKVEQEAAEVVRKAAEAAERQEQLRLEQLAREASEANRREEVDRVEFEKKLER